MPWPFDSRDDAEPIVRRDIPFSLEERYAPVNDGRASAVVLGGGSARWGARSPDAFAREGYIKSVVGFSCIRLIAQAAASVELQLEQGEDGKIVPKHDLLKLFARPSQMLSGTEFMEALIAHRLIYGSAFVTCLKVGAGKASRPKELWLLQPQHMTVETGDTEGGFSIATGYVYRAGTSAAKRFPIDRLTGACDVAHLKAFNPTTLCDGLSPIEPAAFSIDTHSATLAWNKALLDNAAMPSGALVVAGDQGLTPEQRTGLRQVLTEKYSGSGNARTPLVLEQGMDWKQMGLSPTDMDFEKGLWAAAINTCMAFGVPPQMLGIPGSQTFANFEQARLQLWQGAVLPTLYSALATLNNWLAPMYGDPTLRLQPDEDSIPALEPMRQIRYDRARLADYLTVDEKRDLAGYGPLPNGLGDVVLVNASQMPLDLAGADLGSPEPVKPAADDDQ